jgi:hypothetical protein
MIFGGAESYLGPPYKFLGGPRPPPPPPLLRPWFVGNVKVPLLRIVNIEGEYGNTVHASFRNLQYVPVKVNSFETIEVNIKNDQDENVSFEFGKSIATLHFRQKRSQYFI